MINGLLTIAQVPFNKDFSNSLNPLSQHTQRLYYQGKQIYYLFQNLNQEQIH